jgi:hypothetical protein
MFKNKKYENMHRPKNQTVNVKISIFEILLL